MKKLFFLGCSLITFGLCMMYNDEIVNFLVDTFSILNKETSVLKNNIYASSREYQYVSLTDDFEPNSKQDIVNIYYTILNSGMSDFTFYCPNDYKECINDINYISKNQLMLSSINNFVPVYNSFENIETEFDSLGKVDIHITYNYNINQIHEINAKLDEIFTEVIKDDMSLEDKIKAIHDYIINNTKYDTNRSDNKVVKYHSDSAYGALIENYAICGGYADSMKLFLDKLDIPNYKVSSENHIWNLVYLNENWYHLDLTWDDPVTSTGEDVLEYDYFLITNDELKELESDQHGFDESIYKEAKSN